MPSKTTRFEKLLEAVPDALVGMDQEGVIRFVNRQTESLFGYDREDLIGQPIETLLPGPLWQVYSQHKEDFFADRRTRSSSLELVLSGLQKDGTDFPVNISMSQIDTGDVLLVVTAVRDVTSQRRAVQDAQLVAAVVEYSDDAIVGSTLEGLITSWNPAAERMYGYSSKEIIGRSGRILAYPGRADQMDAALARIKAGEVVEHLEINHLRKDGTVFPISVTVAPVRDEDGVIVGSSAVARDVTEQRRAFETAQRMAAIIEDCDDAIISGSLDGSVTSWNPAAERLYGYSAEEIVGKSAEFLTPEDQRGEITAVLARIKDGQHVAHLETKRVRKDGTVFPVSLTVSPVRDAHGAIVGTSVIHRDMTEQKHTGLGSVRPEPD
jgi:PAS domain S-box-containing protein